MGGCAVRTENITLIEAIGGNDCGIVSNWTLCRQASLAGISNAEQDGLGRLTGDSNVGFAVAKRQRLANMNL